MPKPSYSSLIRDRINHLEALIAKAQTELEDLKTAERVIAELAAQIDVSEIDFPDKTSANSNRPLTIAEAVMLVLSERGPVDSAVIHEEMRAYGAPSFKTLSSTLSRMKARNLLAHQGRLWSVPQKKEAPSDVSPSGASEPEGSGEQTPPVFD